MTNLGSPRGVLGKNQPLRDWHENVGLSSRWSGQQERDWFLSVLAPLRDVQTLPAFIVSHLEERQYLGDDSRFRDRAAGWEQA